MPEVVTVTSEHHSLPMPLILSHWTDHLAVEGGDRSLNATVQRSSIVTVFCYAHLRRNRFQLHVPPPQRLTITAPFSEAMAGTRKRTTTSRSSITQEPRSTIQILQSRMIPILITMSFDTF